MQGQSTGKRWSEDLGEPEPREPAGLRLPGLGNGGSWEARGAAAESKDRSQVTAHLEVIIMPLNILFALIYIYFFNYWQEKANVFKGSLNKVVFPKGNVYKVLLWPFLLNVMEGDGDLLNCFYRKSLINVRDVLPRVQIWKVLK